MSGMTGKLAVWRDPGAEPARAGQVGRVLRQRLRAPLEAGAGRLDRLWRTGRSAMRRQLGWDRDVTIQAYRGFGNGQRVWLNGRVIDRERVNPPLAGDTRWQNISRVCGYFLCHEVAGAEVVARLGSARQLVRTDERGYFRAVLEAPEPASGPGFGAGWLSAELALEGRPSLGCTSAEVLVPGPDAHALVVSDIDDTILQTHTPGWLDMAWTTLSGNALTRLSFPGTSELYRALAAGRSGADQNPVFYLSRGPWNLYELLRAFIEQQGLPAGPLLLREVRPGGEAARDFKRRTLERLLATYPRLPAILIGDSAENDLDDYLEIASGHPGRVRAIYIREVGRRGDQRGVAALRLLARRIDCELWPFGDAGEALEHARSVGLAAPARASLRPA
jgi:phosphatidate phosphatase APP1